MAHQLSSPTNCPAAAPRPRPLSACMKTDFVFQFARFIVTCCQAAVWCSSCLHKRLTDLSASLTHIQLAVYIKHMPQLKSHHIAYPSSPQLDERGDFIGFCWCDTHLSPSWASWKMFWRPLLGCTCAGWCALTVKLLEYTLKKGDLHETSYSNIKNSH